MVAGQQRIVVDFALISVFCSVIQALFSGVLHKLGQTRRYAQKRYLLFLAQPWRLNRQAGCMYEVNMGENWLKGLIGNK